MFDSKCLVRDFDAKLLKYKHFYFVILKLQYFVFQNSGSDSSYETAL